MKKTSLFFLVIVICITQVNAQDTLWYSQRGLNHNDRIGLIMINSTDGYFRLSFTDSSIAFGRLFLGLELKLNGENLLYRSLSDSLKTERVMLNPLITQASQVLYTAQDTSLQDGLLFVDMPDSTFLTSLTKRTTDYRTNFQSCNDKFILYNFFFFDYNWAEAMPYLIGFTPLIGFIYFGFDPPVYRGPYTGKIYYLECEEIDKLKKIWYGG